MAAATPVPAPKVNRNYNRSFRMAWNIVNGSKIVERRIRELKASVPEVDYQTGIYNALKKYSLQPKLYFKIIETSVTYPKAYKFLFRELTMENRKKFVDDLFKNRSELFNTLIYRFASRELIEHIGMKYDYHSILEEQVFERAIMVSFTRPSIVAWRFASNHNRRHRR
jgi:hypothetical protein